MSKNDKKMKKNVIFLKKNKKKIKNKFKKKKKNVLECKQNGRKNMKKSENHKKSQFWLTLAENWLIL